LNDAKIGRKSESCKEISRNLLKFMLISRKLPIFADMNVGINRSIYPPEIGNLRKRLQRLEIISILLSIGIISLSIAFVLWVSWHHTMP